MHIYLFFFATLFSFVFSALNRQMLLSRGYTALKCYFWEEHPLLHFLGQWLSCIFKISCASRRKSNESTSSLKDHWWYHRNLANQSANDTSDHRNLAQHTTFRKIMGKEGRKEKEEKIFMRKVFSQTPHSFDHIWLNFLKLLQLQL